MDKKIIKRKQIGLVISLIMFLLSSPHLCLGQAPLGTTPLIHNPRELSLWLAQEFRYEMEMPDYWQAADETLQTKKGDCEDFAILSQLALKKMGIDSQILIIKFKGLNQSHAICIWKDNGAYSFISNQNFIQTKAVSLKEAVEEKYPDWEQIIFTNPKGKYLQVVKRDKKIIKDAPTL